MQNKFLATMESQWYNEKAFWKLIFLNVLLRLANCYKHSLPSDHGLKVIGCV